MNALAKLAVVASFLWMTSALADDASPWVGTKPVKSQLILEADRFAGSATNRAGLRIKLDRGWWTYWRAPGSSGMPPMFDWSGSQNLADEPETMWPVPMRTVAYGEELNLYKDQVIFPVEFRAADPSKPVRLRLKVTFGVCRDVCIPKSAEHEIVLTPASGRVQVNDANARLIAAYAGRKPSHDPVETGLQIAGVETTNDKGQVYLAIKVLGLKKTGKSLVLVEAPNLIKVAEVPARPTKEPATKLLMLGVGTAERFRNLSGKRIRITLIDGGRALEQVWVVGAEGNALVGFDPMPAPRGPMGQAQTWPANLGPGTE